MNKYELNYLQWLTGLPRIICKTIKDLKFKDGKLIFRARFKVDTKGWRGCYGSMK